jgi:outer membrane lipase/esterase
MRKFLTTVAGALLVVAAAPASAATFSSLIVFGDSLVDSGNARTQSLRNGLPDPASPALGYFDGRFSNGLNFADYLSARISTSPATAYLQGGSNFAVGGSTAVATPGGVIPSFLEQLAIFKGLNTPIASDALVLVTFGGNDIRAALTNRGAANFGPSVTALQDGLGALLAAGARNIVVTGVPDIGDLPGTRKAAAFLGDPTILATSTDRSIALGQAFAATTAAAGAASGANVQYFDLLGLETSVNANPMAFGLPSSLIRTTSCRDAGAVSQGCEGYLYFDDLHPTTQVHAVIAESIARQVGLGVSAVPEPGTWMMLLFGFAFIGGALRRAPRAPRFVTG